MPPPMTLETMIAAASSGPRRRSRAGGAAGHGPRLYAAARAFMTAERECNRLPRQQLALNRILGELRQVCEPCFRKISTLASTNSLVLQHLQPRLVAGVAERRAQHESPWCSPRRPAPSRGIAQPKCSPHISVSPTRRKMALTWTERTWSLGLVAQLQRDARHELVLAALEMPASYQPVTTSMGSSAVTGSTSRQLPPATRGQERRQDSRAMRDAAHGGHTPVSVRHHDRAIVPADPDGPAIGDLELPIWTRLRTSSLSIRPVRYAFRSLPLMRSSIVTTSSSGSCGASESRRSLSRAATVSHSFGGNRHRRAVVDHRVDERALTASV